MLGKKKSKNLTVKLNSLVKHPENSQEYNFDEPLSKSNDILRYFTKIYDSVKFAAPPEIFQFYKLISEDNLQVTFNNIVKYDVISFLLQLLSMSSTPSIIKTSMKTICIFIDCSNSLFIELIKKGILDFLPQVYSYSEPKVQTLISILYANITNIERSTVPLILRCASDFLSQSVQWAACHSIENCKVQCLLFQYNVIIGSDNNLPLEIVYHLSSFLQSILVSENISLISLSAWSIGQLVQKYGLVLDLKDIFTCLFSSIQNQLLIDSDASIPILRMLVKSLRNVNEIQSSNELLQAINWKVLFQKMVSSDHEVSYLCCRVCQYLVKIRPDCIDLIFSDNVLDMVSLVYEDSSFKSMCEVSNLLKNIWMFGSNSQKKIVFCHQCFPKFLKFIGGSEIIDSDECFRSMYHALASLIDVDQSFVSHFIEIVPSYLFDQLIDHSNDDINRLSLLISETLYSRPETVSQL